ncbi:hypothetical protein ABZ814_29740 [Micromonospora musae]|uniref:hypothetical protein n=1 Tax=Micromonospora musae TaxID=1894970 RepID=UPI003409A001
MPAKRTAKKSRTTRPTLGVEALTPVDLDRLSVTPAVPPLPDGLAEPVSRTPSPKAGPPVAPGRSGAGRGSQRAGQPRRYAFRRS